MRNTSIQDILHLTEQPSRYLGSEINRIKKDHGSVKLKFLLAFPDLYEIGTSHFGIQILYHLINREPDMLAERVFAPALDMEAGLRERGMPLTSLESGMPVSRFDIIGFSLLYEMNYTNVLGMLSLAGIPFFSGERREEDPLVIAGGPCTSNPEPVADIFDAMVIGDGEAVVPRLTRAWIEWKEQGGGRKEELLREWAEIEGVYIPKYFAPENGDGGFQILRKVKDGPFQAPDIVRRAVIPELRMEDFPDRPIVPFGKPIHDRLRVEVARGCSRGCRFCQAGMIYRPVRERSVGQLMSLAEKSLAATGYEDLSLLSLSTGDYSGIVPLMQKLMARCEAERIAVSFPSLRAGTMSPELMALVKKVRKTGFTMAVEAGSQRLRDVINKNIRRDDIFNMVEDAFSLGWQVIKLYFMIGLPGETRKDLDELVALVKEIHKIRGPKGRKGKINVSVNTFIPKSHTPFQWAGQLSTAESRERVEGLRQALRMPGIQFKWQNPENSFLEGLWARGDRRLTKLLITAYEKGCRFDGWSDQFRYDRWEEAIRDAGIDTDFFVTRRRDLEEPLPWDHIDMRVGKDFLKGEWLKAKEAAITLDCRDNPCVLCGVCDQKTLRPIISPEGGGEDHEQRPPVADSPEEFFKTVTVSYSRTGQARFFGHLELVNILLRAIRRARIPVSYSQGYHPMPKISFDDPLPLGYESLKENLRMRVPGNFRPQTVMAELNAQLPEGIRITDCRIENPRKGSAGRLETYEVALGDGKFDSAFLEKFISEEEVIYRSQNRKGKIREIDLKKAVNHIELMEPEKLRVVLSQETGRTLRPGIVLSEIFHLPDEAIRDARILKTETVYTGSA